MVSVLDDSFIENKETFDLNLYASSADVNFVNFSGQGVSTFTITQDPNDSMSDEYYNNIQLLVQMCAHCPRVSFQLKYYRTTDDQFSPE